MCTGMCIYTHLLKSQIVLKIMSKNNKKVLLMKKSHIQLYIMCHQPIFSYILIDHLVYKMNIQKTKRYFIYYQRWLRKSTHKKSCLKKIHSRLINSCLVNCQLSNRLIISPLILHTAHIAYFHTQTQKLSDLLCKHSSIIQTNQRQETELLQAYFLIQKQNKKIVYNFSFTFTQFTPSNTPRSMVLIITLRVAQHQKVADSSPAPRILSERQ